MAKSATIERATNEEKLDTLRTKLATLRAKQKAVPQTMADADDSLRSAKARDKQARQDAIRIRVLYETDQASQSDVRAAEDAALRAVEQLREAEDRMEVVVATLPALAAAYADTIEAYRAERAPGLLAESKQAIERIDRAFAELMAACAAAEPIAEEVRRDFTIDTNVTGYRVIDGRLPFNLEGLLGGFFLKNRIGVLAVKWQHFRTRA